MSNAFRKTTPILEPRNQRALIWHDQQITYPELLQHIHACSLHLPRGGAHVVVFGENSPAWVYAAYAVWAAGDVLVPVDHMSSAEELSYVLADCHAALILCARALLATVERSLESLPEPPQVLVFDQLDVTTSSAVAAGHQPLLVDESALAAIVYTSGTTGAPKGAMLSFSNLLTNVRAVARAGYFTAETRALLLLPLHHVLPLAGSLLAPLYGGGTIVFATSLVGKELLALCQRHAITTVVGVPRFYDLLHRALSERVQASAAGRGLFALARRVRVRAFSRLVFGSVHRAFGGRLKHLISGGAALSPETAETFDVLGFEICEGYGMTECSPMITFPRLGRIKLGSCGQVLDGCEARITETGEIAVRGPNVMRGYYNRPEDTRAILEDGWLHTGDLGRFDHDGYLYVTGRLKEVLVLGSGKKVDPATIEAALEAANPGVREAAVFLEGDALHALIVPNWEQLPVSRDASETYLRQEVVAPYNAAVSPYRRVARLTIVNTELPRTRLGKLRRHQLAGLVLQTASATADSPGTETITGSSARMLMAFLERQCGRPVPASSRLLGDLGLDSLGRVELSFFVERAFGVTISEARLAEIETVLDLARMVDQEKNADALKRSGGESEASAAVSWHEILHPATPPSLPGSSVYHRVIVYGSHLLARTLFRVEARGHERLPPEPFMLVPNHQSYLDGLLVSAYLRPETVLRTVFYAKVKHVRRPWLRFLAQRCKTVVVDPEQGFRHSLQQLSVALQRGHNLIIFPEGTRSGDGTLGPFKDSYAVLATQLQVPVVPVVIDGAHAMLPAGRRLPNPWRRVSITYLDAVHADAREEPSVFNARVRSMIAVALKVGPPRLHPEGVR